MDQEFESTGGIDPTTFGESLFSSVEDKEPSTPSGDSSDGLPAELPRAVEGSPIEAPAGISQSAWDALPKSWKREMENEWKTTPESMRKYVHEREQQVTEGITGYRQGHDSWNRVTQPFQAIMAEYPNANPQEILATLAQNHIQMVRATPAERRTHALALARGYGVDFETAAAVVDAQANNQAPQTFSPGQLAELNRIMGPSMQDSRESANFVKQQQSQTATAEVDKFFSDPANAYVNEVAGDILELMKNGRATSLSEAYELAVLRNPEVKARYFTDMATKSAVPPTLASKLPNVKSSATPKGKAKAGTMDDTIAEVIARNYPL